MVEKVRSVKDWSILPFLVTTITGFAIAVLDFILFQNLRFQVFALAGLSLFAIGGYIRFKARLDLKEKAGFKSLAATGKLQIEENHCLVKDGLYRHIRHPIYLGETLRNFGIVTIFSSVYGGLFIAAATILILFRVRIEEKMLLEAFGNDYREYQRETKKIIPHIY